MKRKTLFRRSFLLLLSFVLIYGFYYCWISFPVATGYGAKVLCSSIFLSGRNENDVKDQELNFIPLNIAGYEINYKDSSVTCSLFGFAKRRAICRRGLGATVVNQLTEGEIRSQQYGLAAPPSVKSDTILWPLGDKLADSFPSGIDSLQLVNAVENMFKEKDAVHPNRTRAVIIVFNNQIIAERYAPGFTKQTKLTGWSMTKSITSALIGILVKENKLNIDQPAPVPEWKGTNDPRHAITVRHILQQTTGLEFEESYNKSSHATKMLCQEADMGKYAASLPLKHNPGSNFHYSSGNTNILSRIIRQTIGDAGYYIFPYEHLFYKLGMYNTVLEPDASGTFVGSSYCFATARDWARFGLLYFNKGVFNGQQILPNDWVQQSITPSTAAQKGEYGFQWWLNAGEKNNPSNRLFHSLPGDMYFADGYEGQNIFIIPSKKLVIVRLGLTRKRNYGEEEFLEAIIQSIR